MEENQSRLRRVCVTGGSGYVASSLIKTLLLNPTFIVHATLRNLGDDKKTRVLKSFPGAETRLKLFEANIYNPQQFKAAIQHCQYVFHLATPFTHLTNSQYKDTTEAAVGAVKSIVKSCIEAGSVKRLIYTGSVVAASPLKHDASGGFLHFMDDNCWTPFHLPLHFIQLPFLKDYMISKTIAEKEILKMGESKDDGGGSLEVVSLACGLVAGDTSLSFAPPASVEVAVSPVTQNPLRYEQLRFLEQLLGKIPILHIHDVCEAHIFAMQQPSLNGRFLCASHYVSSSEIATYFHQNYPEFHVKPEYMDVPTTNIKWEATKLIDKGFKYKNDLKSILDDSVKCVKRFGVL